MTDQTATDVQFGRPFVLVRATDVSGVSGTGIVANGIQWPDGQAAIHWTGSAYPTTTPHPGGMESVTAVHGHGGATRVVWEPNAIPQAEYSSVWPELVGWVQAAHEDGEQIDPAQLLEYLRELKHRALAPAREWMAGIRDAARQAAGQPATVCVCGDPAAPATVHRPDAPCYAVTLAAGPATVQPDAAAPSCTCIHPPEDDAGQLLHASYCTAAGQPDTQQTDRAAILRKAADQFEERCPDASGGLQLCMCHAADELRRMADEAAQSEPEAEFTEARAAFMQIGGIPALQGLRVELRIEGYPPLVGRYAGAGMRRIEQGVHAIEPVLIFARADTADEAGR